MIITLHTNWLNVWCYSQIFVSSYSIKEGRGWILWRGRAGFTQPWRWFWRPWLSLHSKLKYQDSAVFGLLDCYILCCCMHCKKVKTSLCVWHPPWGPLAASQTPHWLQNSLTNPLLLPWNSSSILTHPYMWISGNCDRVITSWMSEDIHCTMSGTPFHICMAYLENEELHII